MKILIGCTILLCVTTVLGNFPSIVTKCHVHDIDCFTKSLQNEFKTHWAGFQELNLSPFDPIHVDNLVLERNQASPVNIEFKFENLDIYGLKTAKVQTFKGLALKERSVFEATVPKFFLKGNYKVNGHVLILPIVGEGPFEIVCKNLRLKYSFDLKEVQRDGKSYVELRRAKLLLKPEHVHFQLDNLFNGDKALGDNLNIFINENWSDIFQEIEAGFSKALGSVVKGMINKVFEKYPFEEFFLWE